MIVEPTLRSHTSSQAIAQHRSFEVLPQPRPQPQSPVRCGQTRRSRAPWFSGQASEQAFDKTGAKRQEKSIFRIVSKTRCCLRKNQWDWSGFHTLVMLLVFQPPLLLHLLLLVPLRLHSTDSSKKWVTSPSVNLIFLDSQSLSQSLK